MLKIFRYVFFRQYGEETFVYDNKHHKVYIFSGIVYDILNCLSDEKNFDTLINTLKNEYDIQNMEEFQKDIADSIAQLIELELIQNTGSYDTVADTLESEMNLKTIRLNALYSVFFELTYNCNEKCKHCYVCKQDRKELSTQQVKDVLDQLKALNTFHLTLSGGEVSTRRDFLEILTYAVHLGFVVDIFSNGLGFDDVYIQKVANLYPRSFQCSIYSHIPEKHDTITGIQGSFHKTVYVLKKFCELGVATNIKTVMMKENCDDYEGIIALSKSIGATMQTGLSILPKYDGTDAPTKLRMVPAALEKILRTEQKELFHGKKPIPAKRDVKATICGAGLNNLSINPYGDVFPCGAMDIVLGNVAEMRLQDIWQNSLQLKKWQSNTFEDLKECADCSYMDYCAFCPAEAFLERGNRYLKYEEACALAKTRFHIYNHSSKGGVSE